MAKKIEVLAEEGILSQEIIARLKKAWINNCNELYLRCKACQFSEKAETIRAQEDELGLQPGKLESFMEYIKKYVSPEVVNAEKPKEYPLGYRIS